MSTKTPEQRAEERWPDNIVNEYGSTSSDGQLGARIGCATCIREEVEPRDRLLQELVDALGEVASFNKTAGVLNPSMTMYATEDTAIKALAKAKEQFGITPKP